MTRWSSRRARTAASEEIAPALATESSLAVDDKLPALAQAGHKLAATPRIVLMAKAGYSRSLVDAAEGRSDVVLVDVPAALDQASEE